MRYGRTPPVLLALLLGPGLALSACGKLRVSEESSGAEPTRADIEVPAELIEDASGSVRARYVAGHPNTQVVSASATSAIAGARLAFAPGTFPLDSEVLIEEGQSLAARKVLADLGTEGSTLRSVAPAVFFMWEYDEDALSPVTVMIPEPKVEVEGDSGTLAVLYIKNVAGAGQRLGLLPAADLETAGGRVRFRTSNFGVFQAMLLSQAPAQITEVATTSVPARERDVSTPPEAFAVVEPAGAFQPASFRLFWEAAAGARAFDVHLDSAGATCPQPYKSYSALTATSRILELNEGETYICIFASNAVGATGAANNGFKVRVDATPPPAPARPAVAGPVSSSIAVTFRWAAVEDVGLAGFSHYQAEVTKVGAGEIVFAGPVVGKTEIQIIGFDGESYVARVAALDVTGNQSPWSELSDAVLVDTTP